MKCLIMHGSYGSPEENWFRWLERELKSQGHEVILEQFPVDSWDEVDKLGKNQVSTYQVTQSLSSWENYFTSNILPHIKDEPVSFIGHSIAPIFMLHMLNRYSFKLGKAIFVAPFFDIPDAPSVWQFYPVNKTFYSYDFDFEKIKSQIGESHVVYGDNDPYVPATEPPLFAEKLLAQVHLVPKGGHCGSAFKEFPLLIQIINNEQMEEENAA